MQQKRLTARQKVQILEEARKGGQPVAEVCRRWGISTALFYQWERQARERVLETLKGSKRGRKKNRHEREVEHLKQECQRLKGIIAEYAAENLELKKNDGI